MQAFRFARFAGLLTAVLALGLFVVALTARGGEAPPDGRAIFEANCATCHGFDGRGKRTPAEVGFNLKMPDFTNCSFASREADSDWSSTIHRGGRARAFPHMMPAFDQALSDDEIEAVIGYLRSFCKDKRWVRGEFNFPLGLFTEKAFPEDELVWSGAVDPNSPVAIDSDFVFEKRVGPTGQIEVTLPFSSLNEGAGRHTGVGDIGIAWKQNLIANVDSGTIFSVLGEWVLPTGRESQGLGTGSMAFETHALFAQTLPAEFVLQGQIYGSFAAKHDVPDEVNLRLNIGRTFAEDEGYGRAWTPMVELVGTRELVHGASTDWNIVPQFQVSLSRRQHVLFDIGASIPVNNTAGRDTEVLFYLIWDWYDAGLFSGWK